MSREQEQKPQSKKLTSSAIEAKFQQGVALHQQGRLADAERMYREVLQHQPSHFDALHLLGVIAFQARHTERAVELIGNAIALKPDYAEAYGNRGLALLDLKRPADALESYDRAIALKSDFAEAYNNRGFTLNELKRHEEALASCDKAIALKPDNVEAHYNRGLALAALKHHQEAAGAYAEVLRIDPRHPFAKGIFLHQKMLSCDWKQVGELIAEIDRDVASRNLSVTPFGWQGVAKSQRSLRLCAELYNRYYFPANIRVPPPSTGS